MAKPRVFISSTFYDLQHIRSTIEGFIKGMGYDAILSERGNISYDPEKPLDKSCYRDASRVDIFVLLIGNRYGSAASDEEIETKPEFYDHYESVTKTEFRAAVDNDIPVYILVDKNVYIEYETYKLNKANNEFKYKQVDSVNVYRMLDEIADLPRNKALQTFERPSEIEIWLKEQWAGLFQEYLSQRKEHRQLESINKKVSDLEAINNSLQRYLETIVTKLDETKDEAKEIISSENEKFNYAKQLNDLFSNQFIEFLISELDFSEIEVINLIKNSKSLTDIATIIYNSPKSKNVFALKENNDQERLASILDWVKEGMVKCDINEARITLGLVPLKFEEEGYNKE